LRHPVAHPVLHPHSAPSKPPVPKSCLTAQSYTWHNLLSIKYYMATQFCAVLPIWRAATLRIIVAT
jgi:hypothetical protein